MAGRLREVDAALHKVQSSDFSMVLAERCAQCRIGNFGRHLIVLPSRKGDIIDRQTPCGKKGDYQNLERQGRAMVRMRLIDCDELPGLSTRYAPLLVPVFRKELVACGIEVEPHDPSECLRDLLLSRRRTL